MARRSLGRSVFGFLLALALLGLLSWGAQTGVLFLLTQQIGEWWASAFLPR